MSKEKAVADVKRAQRDYERDANSVRQARRKSFERAHKGGLSLREIGEAVGLSHVSVREIIRGE